MIELQNVSVNYGEKYIFKNLNLKINENDFITIGGKSGSGKTTLLNLLCMFKKPDSGKVIINGSENKFFTSKKGREILKKDIGIIFQNYILLENSDIYTNLKIYKKDLTKNDALKFLEKVGLSHLSLEQKIFTLSGGEQQRICIARILVKDPKIIIADEPTGNLDQENSKSIINLLKSINKTLIIVSHDESILMMGDRRINIQT